MSSLESTDDTESTETADESETDATVSITAGERELDVSLPADASNSEAAAIATAIGAHITDRQRAAAAAAAADDGPEYANEWVLEGRLERFGKRRRPGQVEKGDEWKAAGRSFYR